MKRTILGATLWTMLATTVPLTAQQPQSEPFVMVQGTAEVRIPSDRARLGFMVETQAATARDAASQNAERMEQTVRALREAGGQTVTVETGGYQLNPIYRRPAREQENVPTIEAYRAVNHVRVRTDDLTRVGGLIDAGISAGANRISSLTFEARDTEPARLDAVRQAVAKARAEAEAAASALGATLGPPQEVNVGMDYTYPPTPPLMRGAVAFDMAQAAPTPVEPGEQVVRANVSVRYRLLTP